MDGFFPMNLPSGYSLSRSPFLWNPVGVRNFFLFLPSVRYATLGFGVQRRWRYKQLKGPGGGTILHDTGGLPPLLSITVTIMITINLSTFSLSLPFVPFLSALGELCESKFFSTLNRSRSRSRLISAPLTFSLLPSSYFLLPFLPSLWWFISGTPH